MNLHDFIYMNGYGAYVWGSFGVVALTIAAEIVALRQRVRLARLHAQSTRRRSLP